MALWRREMIARHLGMHHSTVRRALVAIGEQAAEDRPMLDRYVTWLREQLERYLSLAASQVYEMSRRRGYSGGPDYFRHRLAVLGAQRVALGDHAGDSPALAPRREEV